MQEKINSYLYFAFASKSVVLGEEVVYSMAKNKIRLIVLANDIGKANKKKILDKATFYKVPLIFYGNKEDLGRLFRKGEVAIIGLTNPSLANAILKCIKEDN